ncbi:hypothetical protein [Serinicoccus sediminis]|uniref:hypothetical protein n=1 Tax=Serinicoccus sediminis TaxID=2306021 RepID=UPI0010212193|nr:hypothetical protein [Serinicoccus sediminis]
MPKPALPLILAVGAVSLAGCGVIADRDPDAGRSVQPAGEPVEQTTRATATPPAEGGNLLVLDLPTPEGEPVEEIGVSSPELAAAVVTLDDGTIIARQDSFGEPALRFPKFSLADAPPRAIVRVTEEGTSGVLDVGEQDFTFGVDFAVDEVSFGTSVDGGNNLIQRGLASGDAQFKIDSDGSNVLCRVAGADGVLEARVPQDLELTEWYRVRCTRHEDSIEVSVTPLSVVGPTISKTAEGPLGELTFEDGVPLSLGGKLAATGDVIRSETDQFNGSLAEPFLVVGEGPAE